MSALNRPEFIKVFLPHSSSKRLKIPLRFIRHMKGRTSGSVFLTGPSPSGNTWKVDLMKKKDGLFFDEGWPTFVRDHSINLGEFLLFRYDGNLKFTVTIYDHSACKKEAVVYAKCSQPADNIAKGGKKRARAKADTSSLKSLGDLPKRMKGCSDTVEQSAAKSFPTKCPYFVVRIQKYSFHACNLHLPNKFLKEHRLSYHSNEKMVLQNQNGESQEVNIIASRNTTTFCAGWISFVRSSYIKEGDTCLFTLVDKFKMHVNIVPPEKLKFYN